MIRRCELIETAARLTLQLEAYRIPDDFVATGDGWRLIARVRDEYTNYRKLAALLPSCPDGCPPAGARSEPGDGHCLTYVFARHMLKTEAQQLALHQYDTWRSRRQHNAVSPLQAGAPPA